MINALSLRVLLFETNLELGHAGDREEQNRQHQKFTFCKRESTEEPPAMQ